jgi:hypothetical protein
MDINYIFQSLSSGSLNSEQQQQLMVHLDEQLTVLKSTHPKDYLLFLQHLDVTLETAGTELQGQPLAV